MHWHSRCRPPVPAWLKRRALFPLDMTIVVHRTHVHREGLRLEASSSAGGNCPTIAPPRKLSVRPRVYRKGANGSGTRS